MGRLGSGTKGGTVLYPTVQDGERSYPGKRSTPHRFQHHVQHSGKGSADRGMWYAGVTERYVLEYESEVIEREKLLKFYRARSTLSYTRV